jgi:hypothetical protein
MLEVPKYVIFDNLGGDSVAINLINGAYYSLTTTGASLLVQVQNGSDPNDVGALSHLLAEGLVVDSEAGDKPNEEPGGEAPFEKFTDLESMLAADPVHDVDDRGWPRLQ